MWTAQKTTFEGTEYRDMTFKGETKQNVVAGVPARLIKSSGKSMP